MCQVEGEVIIMGDMNCHFGSELGNRFNGRSSRNAKLMYDILNVCNLDIVDSNSPLCTGPNHTFKVEGIGSSYVDHCIASSFVTANVKKCIVHEESITNLSDHLPITVSLAIDTCKGSHENNIQMKCVAWNKLSTDQIKEMYTDPLERDIHHIEKVIEAVEVSNMEECINTIEEAFDLLIKAINRHCDNLPQKRYNKHLKPYWNDTLKTLNKEKKVAWNNWKAEGGAKNGDEIHNRYKECKHQFEKELKLAKRKYECDNMDEINKYNEIDQVFFWKLINKHKRKKNTIHPIKLQDNTILTDPDDIRAAWREYFQKLYGDSDNEKYDGRFRQMIEEKVKDMEYDCNLVLDDILAYNFTEKELEMVINSLKNGKAPGHDNVTSECIKQGGYPLVRCITRLFNIMTKLEYIPKQFKQGLLIPIPKGTKNQSYQDNYRGITLLTVISKMYEKCFMSRVEKWAKDKGVIIDIQGAIKEKCSSIHTGWMVKEVIAERDGKDKNTHLGLLDIRKAFDTIWQDGVFFRLYEAGIRGKAWRILRRLYDGFVCKVKLAGGLSEEVKALRGLHQGAPCSMFLFALFINELLEDLQAVYPGIKMCGIVINCMAFADDIVLIASCKTDLQYLFDISFKFSSQWQFEFNASKCMVLCFGEDTQPEMEVMMGPNRLKVSNSEPYLGVTLSTSVVRERLYVTNRIKAVQSMCYATQSLGSRTCPLSPKIASKLYNSSCIPKLLYGAELLELEEESMAQLEQFHAGSAKLFQGLPKHTSNVASIGTIGWSTIQAKVDIMRLMFLWRLLLLPMSCIYKVVIVQKALEMLNDGVANKKGPTTNMILTCIKYRVTDIVMESILSGNYMSIESWKKNINEIILSSDLKQWKVTCHVFKSVKLFAYPLVKKHQMSPWWVYASFNPIECNKCRILMRLMLNCYRLGRTRCCDEHMNSLPHILFECRMLDDVRQKYWNIVRDTSVFNLFIDIEAMSGYERSKFILNGFNSNYIKEWEETYRVILLFVYKMFIAYQKACNLM